MTHHYRQVILTDYDLTIIIQNIFERAHPNDDDFTKEVWRVMMVSPDFESGMYRNERVETYEAAYAMALDQFYEEFGGTYSRAELIEHLHCYDSDSQ